MNKNNQWVKKRHNFYAWFFRNITKPVIVLKYNAHIKKYKLKKNENVLILSNHQTDIDSFYVQMSFNKNVYFVATDTMFSNPLANTFVNHFFHPIPKKKGIADLECIKRMMKVAREGGTLCLFVEGNRSYAEFQFDIDQATVKLVRQLKLPILFYHIEGGNGVSPRFAKKIRKGRIDSFVYKRLEKEDYDKMSDEELLQVIKDNIRVYDSELNKTFKSNDKAEYLERMLFVCPKCLKTQTLYSKHNDLMCTNCGLDVEFTEDLKLKSDDKEFTFTRLVDWYNFQKKFCLNYEIKDGIIFKDSHVKLFLTEINKNRVLLDEGEITLSKDELKINNTTFKVSDINIASPLSGIKISIMINNVSYIIKGDERFNPLKYVFMLNKLDTPMSKIDKYYRLDD